MVELNNTYYIVYRQIYVRKEKNICFWHFTFVLVVDQTGAIYLGHAGHPCPPICVFDVDKSTSIYQKGAERGCTRS